MVREEPGGWGGGGGGGSEFNRVFVNRWTQPNLYISTLFITLQQKVHSRCWRSPRVKTKYTAMPHTPPLARVDVHGVIHAHLCCIRIPVFCTTFCMNVGGGEINEMCESNHIMPSEMRGGRGGGERAKRWPLLFKKDLNPI